MMNQKGKPTVSLEDLLRVKRAERPSVEFWSAFDQELRAKQLAALVEKRPWWTALPRRLRSLARYQLPLGATAVLAITLVSLRDYQPVVHAPATSLSGSDVAVQAPSAAPVVDATLPAAPEETSSESSVAAEDSAPASASVNTTRASEARLVPVIQTRTEFATSNDNDRPSARSIAENRAVAEALLGTKTGFETRALPVRLTPQEPLAQMANPSEARRSRFATAFAAAAIGTSPIPTARVARRLSDEQLYDTIHRFDASGNTVSFKF